MVTKSQRKVVRRMQRSATEIEKDNKNPTQGFSWEKKREYYRTLWLQLSIQHAAGITSQVPMETRILACERLVETYDRYIRKKEEHGKTFSGLKNVLP